MKLDLDHIERVARVAQGEHPGPYKLFRYGNGVVLDASDGIDCIRDSAPEPEGYADYCGDAWQGETVLETDGVYEPRGATAEHIATCSPDAVLALVARIRELEGRKVYEVIEASENDITEGLFRHAADAHEHMENLRLGNRSAIYRVVERDIVGKL